MALRTRVLVALLAAIAMPTRLQAAGKTVAARTAATCKLAHGDRAAQTVLVPTSEKASAAWRYVFDKPAANWFQSGFDDSTWKQGEAPFGRPEPAIGRKPRTRWTSPDIWLRRAFDLPTTTFAAPTLLLHHDEDTEVYLNGILAVQAVGYNAAYEPFDIAPAAKAGLRPGRNTISIHCRQTVGGQYIDVGIAADNSPLSDSVRSRLLGPFRNTLRRIVFTKHFDMGGSHYAYTDAISDEDVLNPDGVVKEFNFEGGSSLCLLELDDDLHSRETVLLRDNDGVIRDPDVSYDGRRILFAWKKSARGDDYHLYEMNVATHAIRQLTFGQGVADYEGIYLPDGNIMFSSTRCFQNVDCWHVSVCNMFLMDADGQFMRRVGYDQVHTNFPQVHPGNGLVTYTRWEYNDRGQIYPQPLFQMCVNGSHQTEFYGNNSYFPTTVLHARGIPGSDKVLAVLSGHHTRQQGKLAVIDHALGRQEASGILLVAPEEKPRDPIHIDQYGQQGDQWQYPYPLDDDHYLVTFRPRGERRFAIYVMNRKGDRVLLASDPAISCNQPIPLAPRPLPPRVEYPIDWRKTTGVYTIQDVYEGPGLKGVARGTVKKLRVVALDFMATDIGRKHGPSTISDLAAWDVKVVLGETPVYEDGSAAFEVPARTPVYFQAIDAHGHVVQTMRSWSTLMPGEVFSCVGCHEDKSTAVRLRHEALALKLGVQPLQPFYDVSNHGFSYPKFIQPILDAKCVSCHQGAVTRPPDLRATPVWDANARKFWSQSYHALISTDRAAGPANDTSQTLAVVAEHSRYLNWISRWSIPAMIPPYSHGSSRSPLIALLEKGHEKVVLTREELDKIACWIDLALPHSGSWTEGMTPRDEETYMRVWRKREAWEREEGRNIDGYLRSLAPSQAASDGRHDR